ncbi:MAG: hypothetical protein ACPGVB_06160 [Chitinophagales bacterium]
MTYSRINISNHHDEVPYFSFKLFLLTLTIIVTFGINVFLFTTNDYSNLEVNKSRTPAATEMVTLVK